MARVGSTSRSGLGLVFLLVGLLVASGCLRPQAAALPTPTASPPPTATLQATPSATPTPSPPPSPTATPTPLPSPSPTATRAPAPSPVSLAPSGQRAYQHVLQLAEAIGSRPAGTPKERAAADYMEAQLRGLGYVVERQGFSFPYFLDKGSKLSISRPTSEELHPLTLGLSAAGQVEGEALPVGLGRPGDIPSEGLQGKIALIERGEITFQAKVENAAKAGAHAAILFNNSPGNFRGRLAQIAPIPSVTLSQEEGRRLLELLEQGPVRLQLSVTATSEQRRSENVIATRKGERPQVLIFGAHYDSVEAGPGANDNASGVAALLELARVLAQEGFPLSLRFMAFAAEEVGLEGSREYVARLGRAERDLVLAMVSLDMVGVGDRLRFGGSQQLVDRGLAIARGLGLEASALGSSGAGASDHASFLAADIPAVLFHYTVGVDLDPRYHTAQDRAEFVRPENLAAAAQVGLGLARALAGPPQSQ